MIEELAQKLSQKTGLSQDKAQEAVDCPREFRLLTLLVLL